MKLSIDYKAIFKDRVVIIAGVGRSGTSILGKLLGSMQPSHYLYEPAILKLMPEYYMGDGLRAILFEDYFLPLLQGKNINWDALNDSYIGNYIAKPTDEIGSRWVKFERRLDAIKHLQKQGLFIIKMTEFALWDLPHDTFPGAIVISIIRNGNDVISSSVARGWFDNYQPIDWLAESGAPWFISEENQNNWPGWNLHTRAACVWRSCVERDRSGKATSRIELKYEDLLKRSEHHVNFLQTLLELTKTELTDKHIADIKAHKPKDYPSILEHIQEPERARYLALMEELGYKA